MEYCGSLCMYKCNHFEESATSMRSWHKPAFVPSNKRVTHEHVSKKKTNECKTLDLILRANLSFNAEPNLHYIAVSSAPCGHCR